MQKDFDNEGSHDLFLIHISMDEKITFLSQNSFNSMFTLKRYLKSSELKIIEGIVNPLEWTIEVYQKNNM